MTIGTTGLKNLRVDCVVGIYPQERATPQPVLFDIELDYDFASAAISDAIEDAMDYDGAATAVTALVQERKFALLETMAEAVATCLLEQMPPVRTVRLEIRKPHAVSAADCSFVRVERGRQ